MGEEKEQRMDASKVYFTNARIDHRDSAPAKLKRLVKAAGFEAVDVASHYVAIKSHFGEIDNASYLRPVYARTIASLLKEKEAKPFMVDCTTLYPGLRSNALDFLECAELNGYTSQSCGCPIIIGDGLRGVDDMLVPIENGELLEAAYIGRAVMDADYLVTITHAKGCAATGFGGCLKNIAMGCASRGGKMVMHYETKPIIDADICRGCGRCLEACANDGITLREGRAAINEHCVGCGHCIAYCMIGAISPLRVPQTEGIQKRIAEYAASVLQHKPAFHISMAIDITPYCDCFAGNDSPIVANVGMLASFDPVALDRACVDLINRQSPITGTRLSEALGSGESGDYFSAVSPDTDWRICNEHAARMGIGNTAYELVEIE